MQLTFWGYVLSIAVLVAVALVIIGIGAVLAERLDAKGHPNLAVTTGILGITLACMLPVLFVGFQAYVYRQSLDTGAWEKSTWVFSFKDDDGVRHHFGFGNRYFYAGPKGNTANQLFMQYPIVYTSENELIGTKVANLPAPEVMVLKGGDFIPLDSHVSFIGHPDDEYELESYRNKETRTLWCFGRYRPLTAADSLYHRLITAAPAIPYQD